MLPAHVDEHLHLPTTLPRTWQSGIVVLRFVNGLAAKIGNPRFDVPRGYEYKNSIVARSDGTSLASALSVQLIHTSLNTSVVAVHHHNQRSRHASAPMFNEFSRKACPHVLLGGAFFLWAPSLLEDYGYPTPSFAETVARTLVVVDLHRAARSRLVCSPLPTSGDQLREL